MLVRVRVGVSISRQLCRRDFCEFAAGQKHIWSSWVGKRQAAQVQRLKTFSRPTGRKHKKSVSTP